MSNQSGVYDDEVEENSEYEEEEKVEQQVIPEVEEEEGEISSNISIVIDKENLEDKAQS